MPDDATFTPSGPLTVDALVDVCAPAEAHLNAQGTRIAYVQSIGDVRQIFSVSTSGGWPCRLTSGSENCGSPQWSPEGTRLAFVRGKAIMIADTDGGRAQVLTDHPAGNSMPRWSPDGRRIAFYSRRRGWSQIWIAASEGGDARRLTDGTSDNDDLQWSPDGTRIAYSSVRGDNLLNRDIFCIEVESGQERQLTSVPDCLDGAPAWSPDGRRIAFLSDQAASDRAASDQDGWLHVYTMDADGGARRQRTFGACEDGWPNLGRGHLLWSPDGARLAFVRNRDGMVDLMTLLLDDGTLERVSLQDGFHQPVGWTADGGTLVALASRPDAPPDLWRFPLSGSPERVTDSLAGGLRREDFFLPERVEFRSRDGLPIRGLLYRPRGIENGGRCPAIVHPHGGPTAQSFYTWPDPILHLFVQEGYAVLEPDFRGSSGYGRAFRLANTGGWGIADANDCVDAAAYLRGLDWIDSKRIGIWGASYGGYLVLCCLVSAPSIFRAGIDLYGDSEIAESYRHGDRLGRLDLQRQMGSPDENAAGYRRSSPVYQAERIESPLLILHGRDDARVVPLMSERMIEALKIEGKFFEHRFYDGEGHGFRRASTRRDAYQRMLSFFDKYLKHAS